MLFPLGDNCSDLRSALSKEAFQAIPLLLKYSGAKFSELLVKYLDNKDAFLIKQLACANRTIVEPADNCMEILFTTHMNCKWISGLLDGSSSKNNLVRTCSQKYFNIVLTTWDIMDSKFVSYFEENEQKIVEFMKHGLNDANHDTRNFA